MYDSYEISRTGKSRETESRWVVAWGGGKGEKGGWFFNGYEVFFWNDENILKLERGGFVPSNAL